jgi:peptidoglycan/xylan/chitin deacetylase (PgdA/CDA1 family)
MNIHVFYISILTLFACSLQSGNVNKEQIATEGTAGNFTKEKDSQGAVVRIDTGRKVIRLIFSADEAFEGALTILNTLDNNHAKASFFLTGNCLREKKYKSVIRQIIRKGHFVGGHSDKHLLYASWDDRQQSLVTPDSLVADFRQNMAELEKYGIDLSKVRYFLPPYEYYNRENVRLIESMGQTVVNYTPGLRTAADYTTPDMPNYKSSQELIEQLFAYEEERGLNGCIILIHPGTQDTRTDKLYLRLDEIIRRLKTKGYVFERL